MATREIKSAWKVLSLAGYNYEHELKMEHTTAHAVKKLYSFNVHSFLLIAEIMVDPPKGPNAG